jgi:amidase
VYGRTNNPWHLERTPGGSSGGSAAALAAGLTGLELGSDIASSIRNPAHYCGIFGHKPTHGICSPEGHALRPRFSQSDISAVGPMARSAFDLEEELRVLADPPGVSRGSASPTLPESKKKSLKDYRVGLVVNDAYAEVDSAVEKSLWELGDFLRAQGATVDVGAKPNLDSRRTHVVYELLMRAAISQGISDAEFAAFQRQKEKPAVELSDMRQMIIQGMTMSHREWLLLNEERMAMREKWLEYFDRYDLLLCLVLASAAFPHDRRPPAQRTLLVNGQEIPFGTQLYWAGYAGAFFLPATVAPIGLSQEGLPIGVQIVGNAYDDLNCLRFAQLLERNYRGFVPPPRYAAGSQQTRSPN